MKLAVVVLAHLEDAAGIELLARYFARLDGTLFVHVDAKVDNSRYVQAAASHGNVWIIPAPLEIYWGGFNTVRAIVRCVELAQAEGEFERFALMTENTIPLVTPAALVEALEWDVEYMQLHRQPPSVVRHRYDGFYYFDSFATNPRHCEAEQRELTGPVLDALDRLRALRARGKTEVTLASGSTWWILSRRAMEILLARFHEDVHLRESFEFSSIPEEQYFHTILGQALPDATYRPCMYSDFSRMPKPFVFRSVTEIENRPQPGTTLFLRKVDMQSAEIADFVGDLMAG